MKKISISIYSFLFTSFFVTGVQAQSLPPFKVDNTQYRSVSLGNYLSELNEENANLKIRRLNIASADANAKDAGMPYLSPILTYARGSMYTQAPYAGYTNPASNTLGAMVTIEGWGKRSAREAQAQAVRRQADPHRPGWRVSPRAARNGHGCPRVIESA